MGSSARLSQAIMKWGIESALGLIFDLCERAGQKILSNELHEYMVSNGSSTTDRRHISQVAYELKRRKYIEIGDGGSVVLTDKAKIRIIDRYADIQKPDGRRRLVSFDIPETRRRSRNAFRRTIKKLGFRQIQKSLWVSEYNIGEMVELAAREFGVEEYVAYFVVESSNIEKHITRILASNDIVK